MKVKELIKLLKKFDQNAEVFTPYVKHDIYYDTLSEWSVRHAFMRDDGMTIEEDDFELEEGETFKDLVECEGVVLG